MLEKHIQDLKEEKDKDKIYEIENIIAGYIKEYCKNPTFYTLSIEEIISIIEKSKINENKDIDSICNIISNINIYKPEEISLLLFCFNPQNLSFKCIKILSSIENRRI